MTILKYAGLLAFLIFAFFIALVTFQLPPSIQLAINCLYVPVTVIYIGYVFSISFDNLIYAAAGVAVITTNFTINLINLLLILDELTSSDVDLIMQIVVFGITTVANITAMFAGTNYALTRRFNKIP